MTTTICVTFDDLVDRWLTDRLDACSEFEGKWVVYVDDGIAAVRETERQAMWVAFNVYGEQPFIVDQVLPERPTVFIGGGNLRPNVMTDRDRPLANA